MGYETVLYAIDDHVLTVTLNGSDQGNAIGPKMHEELRHALECGAADPDVRAIILTGAGRAFCVGAEMRALKNVSEGTLPERSVAPADGSIDGNYQRKLSYMLRIPTPIIAVINGAMAGAGFCLATYCDFRFMLESAAMSTAFARRGIVAEHATHWLLPRLIGPMNALDLLLTGRKIRGDEAERLGFVRAYPAETLLDEATAFARGLAHLSSPRSVGVIKRLVWDAMFQTLDEAAFAGEHEEIASFRSEDFKEGVAHFVERRAPHFTGR